MLLCYSRLFNGKSFGREKLDSINPKCNYDILSALPLSENLSVSTFLVVL